MIKLKLTAVGNSAGVVFSKEVLARLKVDKGDTLYLTESPQNSLRMTADDRQFVDIMELADKAMRRYRNALRELAK